MLLQTITQEVAGDPTTPFSVMGKASVSWAERGSF